MKKKIKSIEEVKASQETRMTRKQALKQGGYLALSAATMMLLLNKSANSQPAASPATAPAAPSNNSTNKPDGIWKD